MMNERTERVLNKGMKNWQTMLVRQVFDHWRYKLRLSKVCHAAPDRTSLHRTAPHRTPPRRTSRHHTAPHHTRR